MNDLTISFKYSYKLTVALVNAEGLTYSAKGGVPPFINGGIHGNFRVEKHLLQRTG